MRAFVESKDVKFDDITITVYELSAEQLISIADKDMTEGEILMLGSTLKADEISRLSSPALRVLMDAFIEVNPNIYKKTKEENEGGSTKK